MSFIITTRQISSETNPSLATREKCRLVNHHTEISLQKVAKKFNVHWRTIQWELNRIVIQCRKKKKAPRDTTKHLKEAPIRDGRLYRTLTSTDFELIVDDEKIFTVIDESVSTKRRFYTTDRDVSPSDVKFRRTRKNSAKGIVWMALSEKGISEPFFAKQRRKIHGTTNKHVLWRRCGKYWKSRFTPVGKRPKQLTIWKREHKRSYEKCAWLSHKLCFHR